MKRRGFLATMLGGTAAGAAAACIPGKPEPAATPQPEPSDEPTKGAIRLPNSGLPRLKDSGGLADVKLEAAGEVRKTG